MPSQISPARELVHDLGVLLRAHHPLIVVDTDDETRALTILRHAGRELRIPVYVWRSHRGLASADDESQVKDGTTLVARCLDFIEESGEIALYFFSDLKSFLDKPTICSQLAVLAETLFARPGAIVTAGRSIEIPQALKARVTRFDVTPPAETEIYELVRSVIADLQQRMTIDIDMRSEDVAELLSHLAGLTLYEIKKILSRSLVERGRLDRTTMASIAAAKRHLVEATGVLEYFSSDDTLDEVAGLGQLKAWLRKRKAAFSDPARAKQFGLSAPRGILLLGVQGCGKSLCAKAVAREWGLPLLRLDPSRIYRKFIGESEANFHRAIRTAESLAPIVLWIDEIEKALSDGDNDGGTSQRVFAAFLSWMQEKKEKIFVIATANEVRAVPPELLRKGRFDEIFFVDLPDESARADVLAVHLVRRNRDPGEFDLGKLAAQTDGYSGAELEQAIVSGLYTAFSSGSRLTTEILSKELADTRPLSVTMSERIDELRSWAKDRTVFAG